MRSRAAAFIRLRLYHKPVRRNPACSMLAIGSPAASRAKIPSIAARCGSDLAIQRSMRRSRQCCTQLTLIGHLVYLTDLANGPATRVYRVYTRAAGGPDG